MASKGEKLLFIIDERIKKIVNSMGFVVKYTGIVTSITNDNSQANVKIAGYDTEFTFLNKSGEFLAIGNGVKIETDSSGLSGGWISERFGNLVPPLDTIVSLTNTGWSGNSQNITVSGMTSSKRIEVGVAATATLNERTAARAALLTCTSQTTNSITIVADGAIPAISIPIIVREV